MKVFLTGATGFVGSHVARALVRRGHEVHALIRPEADTQRIDDLLEKLHPVAGDLALPDLPERLFALRPEVCLHVGWYAAPGKYLEALENIHCLELSLRLVQALARVGCRRFVGIGTCLEYAVGSVPLAEDSPTRPQRLYSTAKLALAQLLPYVTASTGMSTAWARLFYLYGPFEREERLVPSVIRKLLAGGSAGVSSGEQVRDYLHVEDAAGALAVVAESSVQGAINIGSGDPTTVRDLVGRIGTILGCAERLSFGAVPVPPGDPPYVCAEVRRLSDEVGFRPRFGLEEGLRQTIAWWSERDQPNLAEPGRLAQ